MMHCTRRLLTENVLKHVNIPRTVSNLRHTAVSFYSKRSSYENQDVYKIVKSEKSVEEIDEFSSNMNSNWELLSPKGYRFYMPGNVGPAWHDQYSTAQFADISDLLDLVLEAMEESSHQTSLPQFDSLDLPDMDGSSKKTVSPPALECVAQMCPLLLRRGVLEMFPAMLEGGGSQLTIVTLSQRCPKNETTTFTTEIEQEKQVKTFVLVAQEICMKLNLAGYWADFINPFSGHPYLSASPKTKLYETDQRFRCLGFEITNRNNCKVIDVQQNLPNKFVGSLFTTAPASISLLKDILNQFEE